MSPIRALWHLARPPMLPYLYVLVLMGFAWAHWDRALVLRGAEELPWVLAAWTALHAGTLWLNASTDQDDGEVLFGRKVDHPSGLAPAAYLALALTPVLAVGASLTAASGAACCSILAVLYSHPSTNWKAHPLGGPAVNLIGYGLISPFVGWSCADVSANPRTVAVWAAGGLGVLGMYFVAQAFQAEEDRARGYRTLVATHGPAAVLQAARLAMACAMSIGLLLAIAGWLPRLCLVGFVLWPWLDRWLVTWSQEPDGGTAHHARTFARRLLTTAAVGVVLAFVQYAYESVHHTPVAGLGTAHGHPTDRPLLPPDAMRAWETLQERKETAK